MVAHDKEPVYKSEPEGEKKPAESQGRAGKDEACRCKEASEMSPGQLLKLMLTDLAFWKKSNKK